MPQLISDYLQLLDPDDVSDETMATRTRLVPYVNSGWTIEQFDTLPELADGPNLPPAPAHVNFVLYPDGTLSDQPLRILKDLRKPTDKPTGFLAVLMQRRPLGGADLQGHLINPGAVADRRFLFMLLLNGGVSQIQCHVKLDSQGLRAD
jgi:hypothetical protein